MCPETTNARHPYARQSKSPSPCSNHSKPTIRTVLREPATGTRSCPRRSGVLFAACTDAGLREAESRLSSTHENESTAILSIITSVVFAVLTANCSSRGQNARLVEKIPRSSFSRDLGHACSGTQFSQIKQSQGVGTVLPLIVILGRDALIRSFDCLPLRYISPCYNNALSSSIRHQPPLCVAENSPGFGAFKLSAFDLLPLTLTP